MDDFIVLRLTATDTDNTMCHRFKGIHRGRIAVELVHDSIRTEHRSHVFVKGQTINNSEVEAVGVLFFHRFCGSQHDISPFIYRPTLTDSNKKIQLLGCFIGYDRRFTDNDREGDEGCFLREIRLITAPILIESCHDSIALLSHQLVQTTFFRINPILSLDYRLFILAQFLTDIEVAVTQWHRC